MKTLAIGLLALSLAACGETSEVPEDTAAEPAADSGVGSEVGAGVETGVVVQPGLYATGDGTTVYAQTRLNEDGFYVDLSPDGEEVGGGTWFAEGATMCLDPDGDAEDQQERCWINGPANADGSFTSTSDDGSQSYTVTPVRE